MTEGLNHIARSRTELSLVVVAAIPSIFGFPYVALIPVVAGGVLGLGADSFGVLVSAVGGRGGVAGPAGELQAQRAAVD